LILRL